MDDVEQFKQQLYSHLQSTGVVSSLKVCVSQMRAEALFSMEYERDDGHMTVSTCSARVNHVHTRSCLGAQSDLVQS